MRIAHISDLHIRNFKYRDEYDAAFDHLYEQLADLQPDLVINTGDTVHSKLAVSPELFDDVAWHMKKVAEIAPYWITLGNHDLNLKNKTRTDAISPIVRALNDKRIKLLDDGCHILDNFYHRYRFWNHDIRKHDHNFDVSDDYVNVGMYHGSISGCQTDMGFIMEDGEAEVSKFDKMDYVLLGDIHKRQSFRDGRIQYPGSLIQQNYGEELVKGFLLWEIIDKNSWSTEFHEVKAPGRFYTIQVPSNLDLGGIDVPSGSRIRAKVQGELSPSQRWTLEKKIIETFTPLEVITPDSSGEKMQLDAPTIDELVGSRENLMRDHLKGRGVPDDKIEEVLKLFLEYEANLDSDSSVRGTTWQLKKASWDNMMNYGDDNSIDMTKLSGLVGIFAPNASGKSSIFDILQQSLFDKISKEVPRNIDLVNDNKNVGKMIVELESAGRPYTIERTIERIHYGQRKLTETKQWGKTSLDFSAEDEPLNGTSRPETEKMIRKIIGTFEDFALTTMVSQNPIFGIPGGGDIINCKETDRRKILFRFLDLDLYEKINHAVKDDLKVVMGKLKGMDPDKIIAEIEKANGQQAMVSADLGAGRIELEALEKQLSDLKAELAILGAEDVAKLELEKTTLEKLVKSCQAEYRKCKEQSEKSQVDLEKVEDEYNHLLSSRPAIPTIGLDELAQKMEDLRKQRESLKVSLSERKAELDRGKKALKTLDGVPCEGKFPTCKFISEAISHNTEKDDIERAIRAIKLDEEYVNGEFTTTKQYEVQHKDVANWERKHAEVKLAMSVLRNDVMSNDRYQQDAAFALSEASAALAANEERLESSSIEKVNELRSVISFNEENASELREKNDAFLKRLGVLDQKLLTLESDLVGLNGLTEQAFTYESLAELTGKNGLPYRVLTLVLPIINAEIANILSGIVKFSVFFEDDPEDQTVSLYIRYGDYKSRPLGLGSGAEKFIASLAVRVALLSVSSLPKTDILIIDEGFGKLDPEHLEALQRMFEYLKEAFGTVFIVSHVDFMRDIVDHSIEITSQDGYAHVSVT